jgi:hypothetical protein
VVDRQNETHKREKAPVKKLQKSRNVGDQVMTIWGDSDKPLKATITKKMHNHGVDVYDAKLSDGSIERVYADQIV